MKIAIAANTQDPQDVVALHAARAPFYLLYEYNGTPVGAIENPYCSVERGAAPRVAQLLQQQGVEKLIAGEFGPRLVTELKSRNIAAVVGEGQISDGVSELVK
jgi:predicted Fe-Mo cluster-binding NifX family protein